jgi:hypothetical protein
VEGVSVRVRTLMAVAVLVAIAGLVFAGCSSSSDTRGKSDKKSAKTTTTTTADPASAWVKAWKPVLVSDYGPAQQPFIDAIKSGKVAAVRTAGQAVLTANADMTTAIKAAGPAPADQAAAATQLLEGLAQEQTIVQAVVASCTGSNPQCQNVVSAYAENNKNSIIPNLTALQAMR